MNLLVVLAQSTTAPSATDDRPEWVKLMTSFPFLLLVLFGIFYIFVIRSKQTQEKGRKNMLSQLKKGDRIKTIGGVLGTVVEAREDEVLVKVDESSNTKIRFARSAIHSVESEKPQAK